ncbi:MAG: polysaccharide lyase family 8 super-sandwich domain-containing protein, partial [Polaribacter sp.]
KILGLSTADPIFAGLYNRIYGVDPEFNYNRISPFAEGFFQFNYASAAAYRKNNWIAFNKGFTSNMMGSEIHPTQNRYGRYQSYGALEIIYPGNQITGNGYNYNTWDWNFNPGATTIRLPWNKLRAERKRVDELQQKKFVGAMAFKKKKSELLTNGHGNYGLFAMDFQERTRLGFGSVFSSENHNNTFTFKKSNFYFDDIIICLGSGISNDDALNPTVTTLYQRLDNTSNATVVNDNVQSSLGTETLEGNTNHWILNNYKTGFYTISGDYTLKIKKEVQQTPNHTQVWPVDYTKNDKGTYYTGYIDHGVHPSNKKYEYIIKPNSSITEMKSLQTEIEKGKKPYIVHQQDENAHILEYIPKNIWGYAFFNKALNLTYNYVTGVSSSCLLMTEFDNANQTLLVSLANPDLGFTYRSYSPATTTTKQITLKGKWDFLTHNPSVQIISSNANNTIIEFTVTNGLSYEVTLQKANVNIWTGSTDTNWNTASNWTKGVPITTQDVYIPAVLNNPIANDAVTVNTLTIAPEASFILNSGSSLIANSTVSGNITYNRYLSTDNWYLLSCPVVGETVEHIISEHHFAKNSSGSKIGFAPYNTQSSHWDYKTSTSTGIAKSGVGFSVKLNAPDTVSFTGKMPEDNINVSMYSSGKRFNLLGNPYLSYILANNNAGDNNILHVNSDKLSENTLWFWNQQTNTYDIINQGLEARFIPPGQSFFVKTKKNQTSTFAFTREMQSHQSSDSFQRRTEKKDQKIILNLTDGSQTRKAKIYYLERATTGFDNGYDSSIFGGASNPFAIYTHAVANSKGRKLGIQYLPDVKIKKMIIPVGVHADSGKTISISAKAINLPEETHLYLEDKENKTFTCLDNEFKYKITLTNNLNGVGRFFLYTNLKTTSFIKPSVKLENISVYISTANNLQIEGIEKGKVVVTGFDILGKQMFTSHFLGAGVNKIKLPDLKTGIYIIQLETQANGRIHKKIMIKR